MKNEKKLLIAGTIVALVALGIPKGSSQANSEQATQTPETQVVQTHEGNVSLNDVATALNGTVETEGLEEEQAKFTAQNQEIIATIGSGVVLVNGEEDVYVIEENVESSEMNAVKWVEAYELNEEIFVPIPFVERIFDLTFDEENSTFNKDEETVLKTEEYVEVIEEEESEENEVEVPKEETKEEENKKEDDKVVEEKPSTNGNSNNSSNPNGSTSTTPKPEASKPVETPVQKPEASKPVETPVQKPEASKPVETPQPVKVQSVTTNGSSMTLEIGQTKQMAVNVSPANADNKAVTFTSANTAVATVDANGNIKAIGAGTTVIKATSVENSNIFTSIAVTVNAKKEEVKQPTYTSSTILNRTINELGWCKSSSGVVSYLAETGCNTATGSRAVEFNAHMGNNGVDAVIGIFDSSLNGVVSGVETIIRWMLPTQGQQLINKMHDPNYYGGTHTFDGRKVEVSIESYGIKVRIHAKY